MNIITIISWLSVLFIAFLLLKEPVLTIIEIINLYRFQISCARYSKSKGDFVLTPEIIEYESILFQYVPYYKKLSNNGRGKFLNRLNRFLFSKYFEGMEGLEVTLEMQVLISATAVQLTFGLKKYLFPDYNTIYIYPDKFIYEPTHQVQKGNASTSDYISLSWKDFMEGIEKKEDRINLGIHELTHALEFSYLFGERYDSFFADYYDNWDENVEDEIGQMSVNPDSILRKYAKQNVHEFFAVAVECFFETPEALKKEKPDLYDRLCLLLNQDPSNVYSDYCLNIDLPKKAGIERNSYNRSWHWSLTVILLAIFIGPFSLVVLMFFYYISTGMLFLLIFSLSIVSSFLQYKYFIKNYWVGFIHYIFYNLIGVGILGSAVILAINICYTSGKIRTDNYSINGFGKYESSLGLIDVELCKEYKVESISYPHPDSLIKHSNYPDTISYFYKNCQKTKILANREVILGHYNTLSYHIQNGLFGLPVIIKTELLKEKLQTE